MKILLLLFAMTSIFSDAQDKPCTTAEKKILLKNVIIIDGTGRPEISGANILIQGEYIKDIFLNDEKQVGDDCDVIDLSNNYVIPGLIDAHVHLDLLPGGKLPELVKYGITSVRDMAGDAENLQEIISKLEKKQIISPDIYFSALFAGDEFINTSNRVKYATPMKYELGEAPWIRRVNELSNIPQLISDAKKCGATGIKLYADLTSTHVSSLTEQAHKQGMKVWAHANIDPANCFDIITAGVDCISHFWYGLLIPDDWTRKKYTGRIVFDTSANAWNKLDSLLEAMKINDVALDPTLALFEFSIYSQIPIEQQQKMLETGFEIVRRAFNKGINLVAGTDTGSGFNSDDNSNIPLLIKEIELLVNRIGLNPIDAIKCATYNAAAVIGIEKTTGTIEISKTADLVVLNKNPIDNINNLTTVKSVIKKGIVLF